MEKVMYQNKQNGKIGTLVTKNDKFKQVILNVDGQNQPYSTATIKRWWVVIDKEQLNTEETASTTESKVNKDVPHPTNNSTNPDTKVSNTKPKTADVEVFSYIKSKAKEYGYKVIKKPYLTEKDFPLAKKNSKGNLVIHIHFYVAKDYVKVVIHDKDKMLAVAKKLKVTSITNAMTFTMSKDKFNKNIDEILKLF